MYKKKERWRKEEGKWQKYFSKGGKRNSNKKRKQREIRHKELREKKWKKR